MREVLEFQIVEEYRHLLFGPEEGRMVGSIVRVVELEPGDPRLREICRLDAQLRVDERTFFIGWEVHRYYSPGELESAPLYHLILTSGFEPAGEECGTRYDEAAACLVCGTGRKQLSDLVLDLRRAPKKDLARTIADEWIVSQRLAQLLIAGGMTGFELRPVRHRSRHQDDAIDFAMYPSGRDLLERARLAGAPHPSWEFWVWLNRPEQKESNRRLEEEHLQAQAARDARRPWSPPSPWYQLVVTSRPLSIRPPTRVGVDPCNPDHEGRYRCPYGHLAGLNLLTELYVSKEDWDGSDVAVTRESVGLRRGLLVPAPLLLVSSRLFKLLKEAKVKGYGIEMAHLV